MLLNGLGPQPVGKKLWALPMENFSAKQHDTDCNEKLFFKCILRFTIFGLVSICSPLVRSNFQSRLLIVLEHIRPTKDFIFIRRGLRNRGNSFAALRCLMLPYAALTLTYTYSCFLSCILSRYMQREATTTLEMNTQCLSNNFCTTKHANHSFRALESLRLVLFVFASAGNLFVKS